jgi:hydroxymethylglutaryl-CoA reductase (NADPH)
MNKDDNRTFEGNLAVDQKNLPQKNPDRLRVPCNRDDNHSPEIIGERQEFAEEFSGVKLEHSSQFSFDPKVARNNIENFTGVAQVPMGIIGPLQVNGEHAQGQFLIPMCTTEGTLLASYNRGIKVINLAGGVKTTVVEDRMQRAPVFVFDSAREGRDFIRFLDEHMDEIRKKAESTSSVAKLLYLEKIAIGHMIYVRFNYSTGDAAGQNMVSMATFSACCWIMENAPQIRHFIVEGNFATDKKASHVNNLLTRGKRVIAEVTIPKAIVEEHLRSQPEILRYNHQLSSLGAFISGANNNGSHSANGLAAMFIATGQDVANLAESSAGTVHIEVTNKGDLYSSFTIPSLIVASHGGGTRLPTQQECLALLGCNGKDKAKKLAEIMAGVVLAGEISLGAALSSTASREFIMSHEKHGRNR